MNTDTRFKGSKGFTLAEVLVAVAIVALIAGVTIASIRSSRNKAVDAETRKTLSEIALRAEAQEIAPGVVDYGKAFTAISAPAAITELATKLQLAPTDYQYVSTPTSYAIVFPLKKGGYYCVDSIGKATGKEVVGLFAATGPQNCETATRIVVRPDGWGDEGGGGGGGGGGGSSPQINIAFYGHYNLSAYISDLDDEWWEMWCQPHPADDATDICIGTPDDGYQFVRQGLAGVTAFDPQDGDLTASLFEPYTDSTGGWYNDGSYPYDQQFDGYVTTAFPNLTLTGCSTSYVLWAMSVVDSDQNQDTRYRAMFQCASIVEN